MDWVRTLTLGLAHFSTGALVPRSPSIHYVQYGVNSQDVLKEGAGAPELHALQSLDVAASLTHKVLGYLACHSHSTAAPLHAPHRWDARRRLQRADVGDLAVDAIKDKDGRSHIRVPAFIRHVKCMDGDIHEVSTRSVSYRRQRSDRTHSPANNYVSLVSTRACVPSLPVADPADHHLSALSL